MAILINRVKTFKERGLDDSAFHVSTRGHIADQRARRRIDSVDRDREGEQKRGPRDARPMAGDVRRAVEQRSCRLAPLNPSSDMTNGRGIACQTRRPTTGRGVIDNSGG